MRFKDWPGVVKVLTAVVLVMSVKLNHYVWNCGLNELLNNNPGIRDYYPAFLWVSSRFNILGRTQGAVNPNLELLFKGKTRTTSTLS